MEVQKHLTHVLLHINLEEVRDLDFALHQKETGERASTDPLKHLIMTEKTTSDLAENSITCFCVYVIFQDTDP